MSTQEDVLIQVVGNLVRLLGQKGVITSDEAARLLGAQDYVGLVAELNPELGAWEPFELGDTA